MNKPGRERDRGFRINHEIRAPQVRVIADDGKMLGVFTVPEAVRMAQDKQLDLIEVVPNATPPTCKIMDYGKYKYEQKKKAHAARQKQVEIQIKELQLRPRTDNHDIETKLKHARRFLEEGDKVKFNLRYKGREMAYQDMGEKVLRKVIEALKDIAIVETAPKMEGKQLFALLAPDPVKLKELKKLEAKLHKTEEKAEKSEKSESAGEKSAEKTAEKSSEKSAEKVGDKAETKKKSSKGAAVTAEN